jgi:ribosomal protein L11 methyltransferase
MILDPGSAFGTGYHWTTRLCLEFLEQVLEPAPTLNMLDLGTGSGILAIGARLLGVQDIVAVDNDPVAVKVAKENLAINQASDVPVLLADRPPAGPYGLITANLIASLLVEFSGLLADSLDSGGRLICGGIIDSRRDEVVTALEAAGLKLSDQKAAEDWVSLLLTKP